MSAIPEPNHTWADLLNGNQAALKQIYMEYHKGLFQYGMRILLDEEGTRDCIHNLFVKIWTNRKKLKHTDNIRYYLISALRNEIINYRTRENRYDHNEINLESFVLDFSVESVYIRKEEINEQTKKLTEAMNQLTSRQKEIIYLRYFEELDYNQIAEIMDITVKGAYKLSARALEALKEIMQIDKVILIGMLLSAKQNYWH
ncbi:RNA polymerase sigma factor [Pedobacter xixiisoli]|uniref:RNA polymerase sigma factor, sigma-70 family n=1 Tax=Pedobacter xixiisoli TaxID=1476464 RepID=A0A285ZP76_9SPHI|nr:sigma-70 family RNA polymerase sigma factor [Pedobacter xixiisoli]SOD11455.1 RNA polymerase sigma factor, sigma-70 family [Pedobacter xixiisoli]